MTADDRAGPVRVGQERLPANLATQVTYLGHGREAVRLARAALDGAGRAPAAVFARLYTTEACAQAVAGDQRACTTALRKAANAIERARPEEGPTWVGYFSPAYFAGTAVRCFRDLRMYPQALRHGPAALDLAAHNARTRALHTALLATTHADAGDLDAACDLGTRALHLAGEIQSRRVRHRFAEPHTRLAPHRSVPAGNNLLEQLGTQSAAA